MKPPPPARNSIAPRAPMPPYHRASVPPRRGIHRGCGTRPRREASNSIQEPCDGDSPFAADRSPPPLVSQPTRPQARVRPAAVISALMRRNSSGPLVLGFVEALRDLCGCKDGLYERNNQRLGFKGTKFELRAFRWAPTSEKLVSPTRASTRFPRGRSTLRRPPHVLRGRARSTLLPAARLINVHQPL